MTERPLSRYLTRGLEQTEEGIIQNRAGKDVVIDVDLGELVHTDGDGNRYYDGLDSHLSAASEREEETRD